MEDSPNKDHVEKCARDLDREWQNLEISKKHAFIKSTLKRVVLGQTTAKIEIDRTKVFEALLKNNSDTFTFPVKDGSGDVTLNGKDGNYPGSFLRV
jgi:hypothetical protein